MAELARADHGFRIARAGLAYRGNNRQGAAPTRKQEPPVFGSRLKAHRDWLNLDPFAEAQRALPNRGSVDCHQLRAAALVSFAYGFIPGEDFCSSNRLR